MNFENKQTQIRFDKIKSFLEKTNFKGFTKDDLFIMTFIKKGWGQDIAALSNMAEALVNIALTSESNMKEFLEKNI